MLRIMAILPGLIIYTSWVNEMNRREFKWVSRVKLH